MSGYILSNKTVLFNRLEPLQMGHTYRQRWDAEFDPGQITPTG